MQNVLGLSMTGMLMASAVVAVLVLALALLANRKPKRAEKWEKAEIMKQLLALSEREESMQRMKQAMKTRTPSSQPMMRQASTANSKPVSRPAPAGKSGVRANVAAAGKAR
jgi:Flp pilus assembly protein TadB